MKKSSFATRALKAHFEIMQEFLESLYVVFPNDEELKDGILLNKNVVMGDTAKMTEGVEAWCENMHEPLKKGSAKYIKAVESITGSPACVYHAFTYRDTAAMTASSSSVSLRRLDLDTKMKSTVWDDKSKGTCWEYLDELNRTAFDAIDSKSKWKKIPVVPTRDEIQADIARRKASSSSGSKNTQSVNDGIKETFNKLCNLRGIAYTATDDISSKISDAASVVKEINGNNVTVGDMCCESDPQAFREIMVACCGPDVKITDSEIESESWELLHKCIGLATMKSAIPMPMMSGIENMANKLVNDIASGKADMSSLNVETIGQQVLSQVSTEEMNQFANNIDKLLPALGHLKPF
jgi:hypothetical protein